MTRLTTTLLSLSIFLGIGASAEAMPVRAVASAAQEILVVVHPTAKFKSGLNKSGAEDVKYQIRNMVADFLRDKKRVITLVDDPVVIRELKNFSKLSDPSKATREYIEIIPQIASTQVVFSKDGENTLSFPGANITVIGGYETACYWTAMRALVANSTPRAPTRLNVNIPLSAVYGRPESDDAGHYRHFAKKLYESLLKPEKKQIARVALAIDGEIIKTYEPGPKDGAPWFLSRTMAPSRNVILRVR